MDEQAVGDDHPLYRPASSLQLHPRIYLPRSKTADLRMHGKICVSCAPDRAARESRRAPAEIDKSAEFSPWYVRGRRFRRATHCSGVMFDEDTAGSAEILADDAS